MTYNDNLSTNSKYKSKSEYSLFNKICFKLQKHGKEFKL